MRTAAHIPSMPAREAEGWVPPQPAHQVINWLVSGVRGGVEAKEACVVVVGVEGHV